MALNRDELVIQLSQIADEIDEKSDLRGIKAALFVMMGVIHSEVPEHMRAFHNLCHSFAFEMKKDLEARIEEDNKKFQPTTKLLQ